MLHRQCLSAQIQKFLNFSETGNFHSKLSKQIHFSGDFSFQKVILRFSMAWAAWASHVPRLRRHLAVPGRATHQPPQNVAHVLTRNLPGLGRLGCRNMKKHVHPHDWPSLTFMVFHVASTSGSAGTQAIKLCSSYAQAMQGTCRGLPLSSLPTAAGHLSRWQLQGAAMGVPSPSWQLLDMNAHDILSIWQSIENIKISSLPLVTHMW